MEILGLEGLILLFDEAESVGDYDYSYQRDKNQLFLKALIRTARNEEELLGYPSLKGLDYCGRGPATPFLYRVPCGLKLVFAITPRHWDYEYRWDGGHLHRLKTPRTLSFEVDSEIGLEPLTAEALREVCKQICLLYDRAYGFQAEDMTVGSIFERAASRTGHTRLFVKGLVEALDLVRLNNGQALDEILE